MVYSIPLVGENHTGEPQANQERLTVAQAATALGITEGAVRSRIKRGTLPTRKERGTVFVLLGDGTSEANQPPNIGVPGDQSELISSLQDQVRYLREQLNAEREVRTEERRRHDTIVAQLTSRIPSIEAPQEAREPSQTVEEEPERAEPQSAPEGAQEGTERPQQRSGWLAPVDKLPWWQYLLGLGLISLEVSILGLAFAFPASFGFWVGLKRRNLSLWRNLVPMGLIAGAIGPGITFAVRPGLWAQSFLFLGKLSLVDVLFVMFVLFIPALFFISGAIIGRALQRRTAGAYASLTPDIEDPSSAPRPTTPGDGWSPRKQAILGFAGTLIAALL